MITKKELIEIRLLGNLETLYLSNPIYRKTYAKINVSHLRNNVKQLRDLIAEDAFFCPMVKSNAYGHGDKDIVGTLIAEGVENLGVALVEEGVRLRSYGYTQPNIFVFGIPGAEGMQAMIDHNLTPVISSFEQLKFMESHLEEGVNYPVHIKFNTGMYRLGFEPDELSEVIQIVSNQSKYKVTAICTHLSDGEDAAESSSRTQNQMRKFEKIQQAFAPICKSAHAYNSAGFLGSVVAGGAARFKDCGVRPGLAIYGIYPKLRSAADNDEMHREIQLKPVMTLVSEICKFHRVAPGERISYGGHWSPSRPSTVGVVPIGYADGFGRAFSNHGKMLFRGQEVPVVGAVCMDYVMIDLTAVLGDNFGHVGEEVMLFGEDQNGHLGVDIVADLADTISYELITCIGRRVPRTIVGNGD